MMIVQDKVILNRGGNMRLNCQWTETTAGVTSPVPLTGVTFTPFEVEPAALATGMTFTDYLARVRIEKVKNLLLNPHKRVSEAAYEAGFQSLSQFNRVFRRIAGESPTTFRDRLHSSAAR